MTLTFQVERLADVEPECLTLTELAFEELGMFKGELPLDIDWPRYRHMEAQGTLFLMTARDDSDELVGYVAHNVAAMLHYRPIRLARDTAHYLHPAHRVDGNGAKMLVAAERALKRFGVHVVGYHQKIASDREALFVRLGYEPMERIYYKRIG